MSNLLEKGPSSSEELPLDVVKLPSRGVLYPTDHPFHCVESVEFKAMGAPEENILATPALIKKGTAINTLIRSCLTNKAVDSTSLIIGDKSAILLAIRISGFGTEYRAQTVCPECSKKFKHKFDLSNVQYKFLTAEPVTSGQNLFSFVLPHSKRTVTFKLLTDGDDLDIAKAQENRKKAFDAEIDTTITDRLQAQIQSVDSITDRDRIAKIVKTMRTLDSRPLREYISSIEPDLIFEEEVSCKHCGATEVHPIPLGVEFLWPKFNNK